MSSDNLNKTDVLIIGAGPTGLALAAELARRGVACRIVDKAPAPSPWSRAIGIQARTLELFENMGIVEPFTTLGHRSHGMHMIAEGHEIVHLKFDPLDSRYPYLLFLPQSETERLLTEHLTSLGVTIERAVELTAFTFREEGIEAILRHQDGQEETVPASWLIGCDGAHSTVRHLLGLPFTGTTREARFLLADVDVHWSQSEDEFYIYLHDDGPLLLFPMGQGHYRILADSPPQEASEAHPAPTLEETQAIVNHRGPSDTTLSDLCWTSYFRINYRMVSQFRQGRIFLAGDAANIHSPAGAQGMNTGIQDAFNLAWKLALVIQGAAAPSLLDSYQVERYPVERSVSRQSELLTEMASLRHPLAQSLRDHLLPLLTGMDFIQDRVRRTISELAIHYPHSPIVEEHVLGGGVSAGDRAPDVELKNAETGEALRLFQALQYPRSTLLLLSGHSSEASTLERLQQIGTEVERRYGQYIVPCLVAAEEDSPTLSGWDGLFLLDPQQALHKRYGSSGPRLYLIRPDGYVGFRSSLADSDPLRAYLARIFL